MFTSRATKKQLRILVPFWYTSKLEVILINFYWFNAQSYTGKPKQTFKVIQGTSHHESHDKQLSDFLLRSEGTTNQFISTGVPKFKVQDK